MKKFVLKLDLQEDQDKRRALKTVSTLTGIDEIAIDMKGKTLTVIGTVDPISVVGKLRKKNWRAAIISLGPVNEPEKKEEEEEKKDEPKNGEATNEQKHEEEEPKDEEEKEEEEPAEEDDDQTSEAEEIVGRLMQYKQYYPPMNRYVSVYHSIEEDPNGCVIC